MFLIGFLKLCINVFLFFFRFDLIRLVENEGDVEVIRETYERAIANVPPSKEKRYWRR